MIDQTALTIITALAGAIATMAGVMWKMQTTETKFWRDKFLEKGDRYEKAVDTITEYIRKQEARGNGRRQA